MTLPEANVGVSHSLRVARRPRQRVKHRVGLEGILRRVLLALVGVGLMLFLVYPLYRALVRSLQDRSGTFVGLENYIEYFSTPATSISFQNSLYISVVSTVITVVLAFIYAYALTRTTIAGRGILRAVALLPMFIPSLVQALAFIYMFGNNGFITRLLGVNIGLYGKVGIIMSEVFYAFPHALIILSTALALADSRLYEAAESLRTSSRRAFWTITLPGVRYALLSAAFVAFTLALTDFGAPKVVGGDYAVLATDIYTRVMGQQDFEMGATISTILLVPAVLVFVLDRIVQRRQVALVTSNIVPQGPKPHGRLVQMLITVSCVAVAGFILVVYGTVIVGAFTRFWPYNLEPTLRNFTFDIVGVQRRGGALVILWNSVQMAGMTALFGTIAVFVSAYLIEKSRGMSTARSILYLLCVVPLAVPGMVKGLSYIFAFNDPANPLYILYGTMLLLSISTIMHYFTVPFLTAMTALKQLDPEFESIGESLDAPFYRTFWRVTIPVALPSILSIAMYFFLNAMVTLSAIVFLFVPGKEVASLAVMLLDDAGESAQAMAMSLLIVLVGFTARGLFHLATRGVERRTQAWKVR
ncbi:MAG: phosphonate ABC transporter permease [Chloroflexi bacterium RBG_13_68_17]|nr:MAG: phosphonate ABC transporter permease [Chloroflexi bacterium RBG_13_68_17]